MVTTTPTTLDRGLPPDLSHPTTAEDGSPDRRLRVAIVLTFILSGFVTASWAVRIPDISTQVGADHAALGGALLCVSLGALATMRLTGALCERVGPGVVSTLAALLVSVLVVGPGLVRSVTGLGVVLMAFGAVTGMLNVAMNSMGVRLEAAARRSLLPSLHAAFSFGGLGGSIVGGVAASAVGPATHLVVVAGAGLLLTALVARALTAGDETLRPTGPGPAEPPSRDLAGVRTIVITLGAIAGCTAFGEGALSDWAALHLAEDLGAAPVLAAAGYASFSLAMACGRLGGQWLLSVLGETRLLVLGGLLGAVGMLLAALSRSVPVALLGLVLVGLGLANVFPVAIARAGALGGARGVGLASTVGYGGLLLGPALIGFLAARVGLPTALTTVSALAVIASGLAFQVGRDVERTPLSQVLPWSSAEVYARVLASLSPVQTAVRTAAQRHATALGFLAPEVGLTGEPARRQSSPFLDFEYLLGTRA
jgi:MFS family permease